MKPQNPHKPVNLPSKQETNNKRKREFDKTDSDTKSSVTRDTNKDEIICDSITRKRIVTNRDKEWISSMATEPGL